MKRRVIQLVLLLIAGAIVNVAVAWGCAAYGPFGSFKLVRDENSRIHLNGIGFKRVPSAIKTYTIRVGLPMFSMNANISGSTSEGIHVNPPVLTARQEEVRFLLSPRVLPVRALWPGFAINTIFYAAILWVVYFVPGVAERTLRRRRGLCPACAYPVGTSAVCTECGKQLA